MHSRGRYGFCRWVPSWREPAHRFAHQLHRRIWAAIIASLLLSCLLAAAGWRLMGGSLGMGPQPVPVHFADIQGHALGTGSYLVHHVDGVVHIRVSMPDGRVLDVQPQMPKTHSTLAVLGGLLLIACAVGLGAMPVVKRLTRRLDELRRAVDAWGAGVLSARAPVYGCDDISWLARHFNQAAERVESLVNANKLMLANASHELRSPLARLRMGVEMQGAQLDPAIRVELTRSIGELDQLVEEILLASRLDAAGTDTPFERLDLTALAAEECARAGADLDADLVSLEGSPKLLRRMLRNLLDNALRHGGAETPVEVSLKRAGAQVTLVVCDGGPGVPEAVREAIFEPFFRLPGVREGEGGFGLGLALVRKIAERHGGSVRCEGRAGGGACFRVILPA